MRTQCPYCGVGCGLTVTHPDDKWKVTGDLTHPSTQGMVCQKPLRLPDVLDKGRLTEPLYRETLSPAPAAITWDHAYTILKDKLQTLSPDEIYFYISGQLLTEEGYIINKFAKGFLGTNNIDANSRLCMTSAVAAYKQVFGSDGPPGSYSDIDDSDGFFFIGSNAAWSHPVLFQRTLRRKRKHKKTTIITVDPVYTETAAKSDIHIPIKAGTDTVFLNSVLFVLYYFNWIDHSFIQEHTKGFQTIWPEVFRYPPEVAARICNISIDDIMVVAKLFAHKDKVISFWCQGLNQSTNGTMKNRALLNLHLATGRLNEKGCPFSLTGQPNAMGGREVGYLNNGLPGYRDVSNPLHRKTMEDVWAFPPGRINAQPGPTITEAVDLILAGKIKLLWIVCTNPSITMPNLQKFNQALEKTFVIVQDAYQTDTCHYANLILPAAQWGEKDGLMTNSERVITRCQPFQIPPDNVKPDWLIFKELAERMGAGQYFPYQTTDDIFQEYQQTTKETLCDISNISEFPSQWGGKWLYPDLKFQTSHGKAQFQPATYSEPVEAVSSKQEFILLTGRTKKQWHTMTRTGKDPHLRKDEERPYLLMNKDDAMAYHIESDDMITIHSERGSTVLEVRIGAIKSGHIFAPFGYGRAYTRPVNTLVGDTVDPISKEPELKHTRVWIDTNKETAVKKN